MVVLPKKLGLSTCLHLSLMFRFLDLFHMYESHTVGLLVTSVTHEDV